MSVRRPGPHPAVSPGQSPGSASAATSVVAAPSEIVMALWAEPDGLLTPAERDRARRFRFERDRRDFVAAHILARVTGGGALGVDPRSLTLVQRCDECGEPHGVPSFAEAPGFGVSVSHTRGYVAAAVGPGRVGVDAEGTGAVGLHDEALAADVLAPGERELLASAPDRPHAFVRLWVRKEATVKCGRGSLDRLSAVDLSATPLVDLSSSPACIRDRDGQFLLEWQDHQWGVVGAAVTPQPPQLALLRPGQTSPQFREVPVVMSQ